MINNKKVLGIIPARGGSKGLPDKNIKKVAGKPLLAWTIEQAQASEYIDRLILSSEDKRIISIAKKYNCEVPFIRPAELATDTATSMEVVFHALEVLKEKYDYVVLLQVTSPLRNTDDIDGCIQCCEQNNVPACVSVVESDKSPLWMFRIDTESKLSPVFSDDELPLRRQDAPKFYVLNGAVYAAQTDWLLNQDHFVTEETAAYIMPNERSIDIDKPIDLVILKAIVEQGGIS